MLVDAMTMRMTLKPETLDTIVATNLHADILSDLAAALAGSLGIAPTANLNPERTSPSMFEPIHGSAFDITGKGIANPVATFWTGAMMLEHLGETKAAARLMRAVERVTADPACTRPTSAAPPRPGRSPTPCSSAARRQPLTTSQPLGVGRSADGMLPAGQADKQEHHQGVQFIMPRLHAHRRLARGHGRRPRTDYPDRPITDDRAARRRRADRHRGAPDRRVDDQTLGQQLIVENVGGAGGTVGAARASGPTRTATRC